MRVFNIILLFLSFFYLSNAQIILANETAVSGDDWSAGNGFNQWSLNSGTSAGNYVGNPNDVGISPTNIGDSSFALYAGGNEYANAYIQLDQPMQVGEKLTFYWAINWDANGGSKGFDFQHSSTSSAISFFTILNTNSATITAGGGDADTAYGTTPMLVTLDRTSAEQYQFTMTKRSGGSDFTSTVNETSALDQIKFFCGNQNDGNGERNMFFNKFKIQSNSNSVTFSSDRILDNLEVLSSTTLTIEPSGSLGVNGTLTNNGTIVMQSSSTTSSALKATSILGSGTYTYQKHVASTSTNDLISASFTGETFSDIDSNTNLYTNPADATQYLFGPFDNNTGAYLTYDSDTDGSETMVSGKGFRVGSYGQATDLFISEYAEGSSNNKYIEIYNGTGSDVDLSNYAFAMTSNAPATTGQYENWVEFTSGATIAAGDVYVIAHPLAVQSILANADQTYGSLSNGDDGFGLVYGTEASYTVIDWLGDWSGDPGSGWSVAGTSSATKDRTLVRKSTVCSPNTDWSSSAGTNTSDSEWIIYSQNTWDYLGSHSSNCSNSVSISGTFETSNQSIAINVGSDATYGKWNLVGNPFPSYLDLDGFISDNSAILEDVNNAVYAYDGDDSDGSNFTIYHSSNSSGVTIAPGQAFFVASSSSGGDLVFNTSRQTVSGGDDFLQRQTQTIDSFFKLNLESSNSLTHTDFYFNSNAGEGLDIGYDVGTYANLASSFSLYSKLASGAYSETNFAIQTISNDLFETVVIPLGVHISAGENHSISIDDVSLLESANVYLKDYETGALTLLNNGAYSFNSDSNLEGISRFELRLTNTTLGIESDELITNFKAIYQNDGVVLVGDFMLDDKVEIYDIMGRLTQIHTINGNHSIEITKDELAIGVYLAKINREGNSKTIKLIIN